MTTRNSIVLKRGASHDREHATYNTYIHTLVGSECLQYLMMVSPVCLLSLTNASISCEFAWPETPSRTLSVSVSLPGRMFSTSYFRSRNASSWIASVLRRAFPHRTVLAQTRRHFCVSIYFHDVWFSPEVVDGRFVGVHEPISLFFCASSLRARTPGRLSLFTTVSLGSIIITTGSFMAYILMHTYVCTIIYISARKLHAMMTFAIGWASLFDSVSFTQTVISRIREFERLVLPA